MTHAERQKKRRQIARSKGLCGVCCRWPTVNGRFRCLLCESYRVAERTPSWRRAAGVCSYPGCQRPADDAADQCAEHLDKKRASRRESMRRKRAGEPMRRCHRTPSAWRPADPGERLVVIEAMLRQKEWTTPELAERFGVSRAAIRQDLVALRSTGRLEVASAGQRRVYRIRQAA